MKITDKLIREWKEGRSLAMEFYRVCPLSSIMRPTRDDIRKLARRAHPGRHDSHSR